jgi:hypothetical protein
MIRKISLKQSLKIIRWRYRRGIAALRWGPESLGKSPAILGNAMPKSGSHLIFQILQGLPKIGPAVNPGSPPLNRSEDNRKLSSEELLSNIMRMKPGDIAYGYIHSIEPYISIFKQAGKATVFVFRDPRDVIVSHVFYASEIHNGHGMHEYYTSNLDSLEERINAAILGVKVPGYELAPIRTKYQKYLNWFDIPEVSCIRFEDLILDRENTLKKILEYLIERGFSTTMATDRAIQVLQNSIQPKRSGTFRKGEPGNWVDHFTENNIQTFKNATGDLLNRLGYEQSPDW